MLKANTKKVFFILIPLSLAIFAGCSGPEEKRANRLDQAAQQRAAGNKTAALSTLETLAQAYPNDPEILQGIGGVHHELGNSPEAAFYLSAAYALAPNDVELLYKTYRAQENANQFAAAYDLLEALAAVEPDAINAELWLRLGEFRVEAQQTQPALDAYLKGVDPENSTPAAETAVAIGTLFKQLDNLTQAERWLNIAANSDDPNALSALFGLLDIHLRNKNWTAAETAITQLDKQFPGAVDASEWAKTRSEITRWRSAQEAMQTELSKTKAATEAAAKPITDTSAVAATDLTIIDAAEAMSEKAQIIVDMQRAEAMATTPALEVESASSAANITFDPNIAIEPAEPALSYDQKSEGATTNDSVGTSNPRDSIAPDLDINSDAVALETIPTSRPTLTPRSLKQLLADAESASIEHNYKQAIQLYWQALGRANARADIWNQLSLAYRLDGQGKNAETTALEATRLAPQAIDYTLDYLRVVQRTKKPENFLAELETSYDRFPRSPEIALSLARGYERISGNNSSAIVLYERFIQLAPNHPLRNEAEASINRLR
ncbi:MAG: tetratricopeptide repeat protein [Opitutae bacterium]|nr:tetratricopeptide repeat protein [Opitutae bacterium]